MGRGSASFIATLLDWEMLEVVNGVPIAPSTTRDEDLDEKTGAKVSKDLGGRYLLRYLLPQQAGQFQEGSPGRRHCVTPTPYAPEETISWLALPEPTRPRTLIMLLDPSRIQKIRGPRWIRLGKGIEYILPDGFPKDAIVFPWEIQVT